MESQNILIDVWLFSLNVFETHIIECVSNPFLLLILKDSFISIDILIFTFP